MKKILLILSLLIITLFVVSCEQGATSNTSVETENPNPTINTSTNVDVTTPTVETPVVEVPPVEMPSVEVKTEANATVEVPLNVSTPVDESFHVVTINDKGFTPNALSIKVGDTVEWKNTRGAGRLKLAMVIGTGPCAKAKSDLLNPGETYRATFDTAAKCTIVEGVTTKQVGTITIK